MGDSDVIFFRVPSQGAHECGVGVGAVDRVSGGRARVSKGAATARRWAGFGVAGERGQMRRVP